MIDPIDLFVTTVDSEYIANLLDDEETTSVVIGGGLVSSKKYSMYDNY